MKLLGFIKKSFQIARENISRANKIEFGSDVDFTIYLGVGIVFWCAVFGGFTVIVYTWGIIAGVVGLVGVVSLGGIVHLINGFYKFGYGVFLGLFYYLAVAYMKENHD